MKTPEERAEAIRKARCATCACSTTRPPCADCRTVTCDSCTDGGVECCTPVSVSRPGRQGQPTAAQRRASRRNGAKGGRPRTLKGGANLQPRIGREAADILQEIRDIHGHSSIGAALDHLFSHGWVKMAIRLLTRKPGRRIKSE